MNKSRQKATDPSVSLHADIFQQVLSTLDAKSLGRCMAVSRSWRAVAEVDFLWELHRRTSWEGKDYIDPKALRPALGQLQAYSISMQEGRRTHITMEELCTLTWSFRFTQNAPEYWASFDPSRYRLPPLQRYFHRDGFVSAGPNDPVWGGHACNWRFVRDRSGKLKIRVNHWPLLEIRRTPTWGWTLQNRWTTYTSNTANSSLSERLLGHPDRVLSLQNECYVCDRFVQSPCDRIQ